MQAGDAAGPLRGHGRPSGAGAGGGNRWGRYLLKGGSICPIKPTNPFPKLFSELETPTGKGEGPESFVVSKSGLGSGAWPLTPKSDPETGKRPRALQNQRAGENKSPAGLRGFSSFRPASLAARTHAPRWGLEGKGSLRKGCRAAGWGQPAPPSSPTSCVTFRKLLYLSRPQFP